MVMVVAGFVVVVAGFGVVEVGGRGVVVRVV